MYQITNIIIVVLLFAFGFMLCFVRSKDEEEAGKIKQAKRSRVLGIILMIIATLSSLGSTLSSLQ